MNALDLMSLGFMVLALVFAGAWYLAFAEGRRLRTQKDEMADSLRRSEVEVAQLRERARALEEARTTMSEQFQLVSQQAMQVSADSLLKRAEEAFVAREKLAMEKMSSSLKPVAEHLTRFEAQVKAMEEARAGDTGGLKQQIADLLTASNATREVTQKLAGALRRGAGVQGRWGEEVLRNVLQAAGLSSRYDFIEQQNLDGDEGRRRPDVVVKLPGNSAEAVFVIDSKVNLTAYLEAAEATDEATRDLHLKRHAQALRAHVRDLSAKAYWDQFKDQVSPDFVVMFIPGDGLLSTALDHEPNLMTEAMDRKVIIVTPTTLFALCKAVAYGWRVEDQMKNANQIADLGRELYARLSVMGGHVGDLGSSLSRAVDKYNAFVGSLETKVLTQARRFEDLQVEHQGKSIPDLPSIETQPRAATKLQALSPAEDETV
ncbi:DNA recombination protein RmuC [Asticcacaulis biprosthecium]|nr:DNA recombination protein RmuC [Asticcacaulis biprosthecium]